MKVVIWPEDLVIPEVMVIPEDMVIPIKSDNVITLHRWLYNANTIVDHVKENEEDKKKVNFNSAIVVVTLTLTVCCHHCSHVCYRCRH
jgi:hypothetical protein